MTWLVEGQLIEEPLVFQDREVAELHCEYLTDHLQGQWHIQQCGQTFGVEVHKDERSTSWVVGDGYVARVRQVEVI